MDGEPLPAGMKLSFNGRFVHDIPEGFRHVSENGTFRAAYSIGRVGDEVRELLDFRFYKDDVLLYQMDVLPGDDLLISNSGHIAVFDMRFHFKQEVSLIFFDKSGNRLLEETYSYASLFGFSPTGAYFGVGAGDALTLIHLPSGRKQKVAHCSQFAFSENEKILATAKEDELRIYEDFNLILTYNTGFFYPRAVAVSGDGAHVAVVDKHRLINYTTRSGALASTHSLPGHLAYRDLMATGDNILAGVHERGKGISRGILQVMSHEGTITDEQVIAERTFDQHASPAPPENKSGQYEAIPWPFVPFDEMHTVWNYYEQHMGNGYDMWSYLHQGLDIITPIDEPTYAVQGGYVKCVLTLGGALYWRVAISPEQVAGYSDGWLYAHLVEGSIQVDVGDYVELHDYLGDIIYWTDEWGHIHFVEIRDQGLVWYYDDDEWGINFNPLLALTPNTDTIAPVIEDFSANSKFGFLVHGTFSNFLNPLNLYGEIDIIAKITDYHDNSPWELPAFKTYYTLKRFDNGATVVPKTLGRKLNHSYAFYSSGAYEPYAPILYHKDNQRPPPAWMSETRDYYQVLTRNNGDTLIHLNDMNLSFSTSDYYDGYYMLYVEAGDECGNMSVDSQMVYFNNGYVSVLAQPDDQQFETHIYPNPAKDQIVVRFFNDKRKAAGMLTIHDATLQTVKQVAYRNIQPGMNELTVDIRELNPGIYYLTFRDDATSLEKFVIIR